MIRVAAGVLLIVPFACVDCSPACGQQPDPTIGKDYVESFDGLNIEMVWIPGGTFQMGSRLSAEEVGRRYGFPAEGFATEHPLHRVTLDGFWLGKFEVTNEQFRHFIAKHRSGDIKGISLDDDRQPVVEVTWEEAMVFGDWVSRGSGRDYTLPSEAQWEYACRGGTETVRFWGDDDTSMGLYANVLDETAETVFGPEIRGRNDGIPGFDPFVKTNDGFTVAAPVGSLKPNAYGLHDMIGNAFEYCLDFHDPKYYERSPEKNPVNLTPAERIVTRGGSWMHPSFRLRAALRGSVDMGHRSARGSFRVCRNP